MERKSLGAAYFFLGVFALISQTMLLREFFVVVYGNELIFGVLLANWLIGVFGGAFVGGWAVGRVRDGLGLFVVSLLVLVVVFPFSLTAVRFLYSISGTVVGTYVNFFNVICYSALFVIPVSFFIGFSFPVAVRVHSVGIVDSGERVRRVSSIYVLEALGSLVGGVVYTFLLVGRFNPYFIAALVSLPLIVSGGLVLRRNAHSILRVTVVVLVLLNVVLVLPFINRGIENYTVHKRWQTFSRLPLVVSRDSRRQNIAVAELAGQYNLYLNTMLAAVFPNDNDRMVLAAHLVSQHPSPRRILVIGDAVSGLAKHLLRYPESHVREVVSVEIDPLVVETTYAFLGEGEKEALQNNPRFEVIIRDGRKYIKDLAKQRKKEKGTGNDKNFATKTPRHQEEEEKGTGEFLFDLVYVNVSEPSTLLLNRYYSEEFFRDLSAIMTPGGVVALQVTASENYAGGMVSDYTAVVYHTVKTVFPHIAAAPGPRLFIFAGREPGRVSDSPDLLEERYVRTGAEPRRLGMIFHSMYPPEQTAAVKAALEGHPSYRINRDDTPAAAFYFNKIIGWYGHSRVAHVLEMFEAVTLPWVIGIVLVFFFARVVYVFLRRRGSGMVRRRILRFHVLIAVFSGGMAGLALELVILYTFQNRFGDVYHIIGLIIAVFMAGLPLGARRATVWLKHHNPENSEGKAPVAPVVRRLIVIQGLMAATAFGFPYAVETVSGWGWFLQVFIFIVTLWAGFVVGFLFPLAVGLVLGGGVETGKAAGVVDAVDHMGAAFGALVIGTLLLPVLGVFVVCRLPALFSILSVCLLLRDARKG